MITARSTCAFALLLSVVLVACKQGGHDPAADAASLDKAAAGWEAAYNEKNAESVAALYTEDGQLLPPGAGTVTGRPAIKDFWSKDIATQWAKISIRAESSTIAGDWAYRSGAWSTESAAQDRQIPRGVETRGRQLAAAQGHLELGCHARGACGGGAGCYRARAPVAAVRENQWSS